MNPKRNFSFPRIAVLLIALILFSYACSREDANGQKVESDKAKSELKTGEEAKTTNLQPEQGTQWLLKKKTLQQRALLAPASPIS